MADLTVDLGDLKDTVAGIASGVAAVVNQLRQQPNITPEQIASLEQQTRMLHDVKAALDAAQQSQAGTASGTASPPTGTPPAGQAGTTTPTATGP